MPYLHLLPTKGPFYKFYLAKHREPGTVDRGRSHDAAFAERNDAVLVAVKRHGEATADELAATLETPPVPCASTSARCGPPASSPPKGAWSTRSTSGPVPGHGPDRTVLRDHRRRLSIELLDTSRPRTPNSSTGSSSADGSGWSTTREQLAGRPIHERVDPSPSCSMRRGSCRPRTTRRTALPDQPAQLPIWTVANRFRQACTASRTAAELIPDATVQRVTHKTAGAHTCAYESPSPTDRGVRSCGNVRADNETLVVEPPPSGRHHGGFCPVRRPQRHPRRRLRRVVHDRRRLQVRVRDRRDQIGVVIGIGFLAGFISQILFAPYATAATPARSWSSACSSAWPDCC